VRVEGCNGCSSVGLARLDDEDEPPRLGGLSYGERTVAVGRRKF
jgi:hypothetical protein